MNFKDYFSVQSKEYSEYRPKYPGVLFEFLRSLCTKHKLAWDCATGTGQAAVDLVPYFDKIIATDASASQIEHAEQHPKIIYYTAPAEDCKIESASVDLVTVATAIHWLDTDKFYAEAKRVLKPGGVIAVWVYGYSSISPVVNKVLNDFDNIIKSYWPAETKKAWDFETAIDFPFERITTPEFKIEHEWDLHHFLMYLFTWSGTQNFIKKEGRNPLEDVYEDFKSAWGGEDVKRKVIWDLKIKAGRI